MKNLKVFKNSKVIITGHTGFKGSWLTAWLKLLGANIMGISINSPTNPSHFKVSKIGKVAGSKVIEGEITQDANARVIRDGAIIYNGKIGSIFREKNEAKQVSAGIECGISLKDFSDFQKKDIIEAYNSKVTQRSI